MIDFKIGDFGNICNVCGDCAPYQVVARDGNNITVQKVTFELAPTTRREMGASYSIADVLRTETVGEPFTLTKDIEKGIWRTEIVHRYGKRVTKRTNPRDLTCTVLREGFYSYYNPHI